MRLLLDEMFPSETAKHLREECGHDAVHVDDLGLRGAADPHVASVARAEGRAMVTEKVADYAHEDDLVLVCVLKHNLPAGGAQANALAKLLDAWCRGPCLSESSVATSPTCSTRWPTVVNT